MYTVIMYIITSVMASNIIHGHGSITVYSKASSGFKACQLKLLYVWCTDDQELIESQ